MRLELYTSAFCGACHAARASVAQAERLVPALSVVEIDVVRGEAAAERRGIASTPAIVLTDETGTELFRASGAPTVPQLLTAIATSLPDDGMPVDAGAPGPAPVSLSPTPS